MSIGIKFNFKKMQTHHFTFLGFSEFEGEKFIFTGHKEFTCQGSLGDVVSYLEDLKNSIKPEEPDMSWADQDGNYWHAGAAAIRAIEREIQSLQEDEEISTSGT